MSRARVAPGLRRAGGCKSQKWQNWDGSHQSAPRYSESRSCSFATSTARSGTSAFVRFDTSCVIRTCSGLEQKAKTPFARQGGSSGTARGRVGLIRARGNRRPRLPGKFRGRRRSGTGANAGGSRSSSSSLLDDSLMSNGAACRGPGTLGSRAWTCHGCRRDGF